VSSPYNYSLISLSVLIAICASFVAISLSGRILVAQGLRRRLWIVAAPAPMGLGIFSMHHIGLLAFTLPISAMYDLPALLLSLVAAVFASAWRWRCRAGRTLAHAPRGQQRGDGLGFSVMHYVGIDAMRLRVVYASTAGVIAVSIRHPRGSRRWPRCASRSAFARTRREISLAQVRLRGRRWASPSPQCTSPAWPPRPSTR
jgi:NO-binding membrane sensor protein with MHYT domain